MVAALTFKVFRQSLQSSWSPLVNLHPTFSPLETSVSLPPQSNHNVATPSLCFHLSQCSPLRHVPPGCPP